nr:MAG TPA: hypothetical protein [Caudoviricetes sp.]
MIYIGPWSRVASAQRSEVSVEGCVVTPVECERGHRRGA